MEIQEYIKFRDDIFDDSKDEDGFIQESNLLSQVLPSLLDAKLVDSEDYNDVYLIYQTDKLKVNGYAINESGERLQLFIVDESSINQDLNHEELIISKREVYDNQFKRVIKFINKAIKKQMDTQLQDAHPIRPLVTQLSSSDGIEQYDVIEIFLVSFTITVTTQGANAQPRRIHFDEEKINVNYTIDNRKKFKEIIILKSLVDLNFLLDVQVSKGNREPLTIDFLSTFNHPIEVIQAADEKNFESYLCVLPAQILSELYKRYSTRLLEKNVRSFLQFKGVNKGLKDTIRREPEKFIAYNNGLTITSIKARIVERKGKLFINELTDFQIVNGGQTTASIYFSRKEGQDISKIKVMAKINIAKSSEEKDLEELISNISNFSNAQSRVSSVDLKSRNSQLVKLKKLSDSIVTPKGAKWFFERTKGEFNTKVRISGSNNNRVIKEYPIERRFTKEQLAKYFSAWDDKPYMVKKGGEKVFRYFIERLSDIRPEEITRDFYEELIAKIILFRTLEKIYGQNKNSIGQIRSAVVPYAISVLYKFTDGSSKDLRFNMNKIWMKEGLDDDLSQHLKNLMILMNRLIKEYSTSDDLGEYSKKQELWDRIINSNEIKAFMLSEDSNLIIKKYTLPFRETEKRINQNTDLKN